MIDPDQLSRLFNAHAAVLVLYARQWLDAAAAEDAVQEAYVRLLQEMRLPKNAKAWLYRTVRNQAITQFRSHQRRRRREQTAAAGEVWFAPAAASWLDALAAQAAIEQLDLQEREVLVLRIWGEMKLSEIAEVTRRSTSTVFDQYRAALAALRKTMGVPCPNNNQ